MVLVIVMLAIFWILVAPQVDLDPATPLNLETIFFAVVAISIMLEVQAFASRHQAQRDAGMLPLSCAPPMMRIVQIAPLRC